MWVYSIDVGYVASIANATPATPRAISGSSRKVVQISELVTMNVPKVGTTILTGPLASAR